MNIFDNIGCEFITKNDKLIITASLPGYTNLNFSHCDNTVPYLARNIIDQKNIEYELGTCLIIKNDKAIEITNRKILTSSNNNNIVNFSEGKKEFYIFVNSNNFNTAFNNVDIVNTDFIVDTKKTIYIVDVSSGYINAQLPPAQLCKSLEVSFKTINDGSLNIYDNSSKFSILLSGNKFTSLVSTGQDWVQLKDAEQNINVQSVGNFVALSDPSGDNRSLQYKDGNNFSGSLLYIGNNNKLLFGSSLEASAKHVISSSGNSDILLNQTKDESNFIVYGSGNRPGYPEKNLYFTSDGRLGINMPSGINSNGLIKPATVFHIINTTCQEGIRLENRSSCHPADITLYNNPINTSVDGSTIGQVSFKGKNSQSNKIIYNQIKSINKGSSKGQLDIVSNNGSSGISTISTSSDSTIIRSSLSTLNINNTESYLSSNGNISISGSNVNISSNINNVSSISLNGSVNINNDIKLPYISQSNVLLGIDGNKKIVAATGFKIPGIVADGKKKILSTESDGTVVASSSLDSFWPYEKNSKIGGKDLVWERFNQRTAEVCVGRTTKELQLSAPVEPNEYSINDQIAIEVYNNSTKTISTMYKYITDIVTSGTNIIGFILDSNLNITAGSSLSIYSVTKGGILTNQIYTSGTESDATANILSSRPGVGTVFNTLHKDIDFTIYGSDSIPALNIISSASLESRNSGVYFKYATQFMDDAKNNISPFQTNVGTNGEGVGNSLSNNSVNYNQAADVNVWPNRVTRVGNNGRPSFYGTFDQNGNVYEWVEDFQKISSLNNDQYVCGGSWRTSDIDSLRGFIPTPRISGFDDIGFRICSRAGFSSNTIESDLGLAFVRVDDPGNDSDEQYLYTESYDNRFTANASPDPVFVQNLGKVDYSYNISKYEITNYQYVQFLNDAATGVYPGNLYNSNMSSSNVGGILRSGDGSTIAYSYYVKANMSNMPVVYVDYLSAIRFINWLNNKVTSSDDIENGSYSIYGTQQAITKNREQYYWLPSLNEWHKAAYYKPLGRAESLAAPAITIKRNVPYEYASGLLSSVSISGNLYADSLNIGSEANQTLKTSNNGINYRLDIGPSGSVVDETLGAYSTFISSTGITLATNGNTVFVNKINPVTAVNFTPAGTYFYGDIIIGSGLNGNSLSSTGLSGGGLRISASGLEFLDSSGKAVSGGMYPGEVNGFVYKQTDKTVYASNKLINYNITGVYYPKLTDTAQYQIIHNDINGILSSSDWFRVGYVPDAASNLGEKVVSITSATGTGISPTSPVLYTDRILIGPPLEGYAGSILTHNGKSPASWQPNDFLKAPGAVWNRYKKRSVQILSDNTIKFTTDINESDGGTGAVSLTDIEKEFEYNETIALMNQNRDIFYVKVSHIELTDAEIESKKNLFSNDNDKNNLVLTICPPLSTAFKNGSVLQLGESNPHNGKLIAYAFSVQKGAYMDMLIEPDAKNGFNCITSSLVEDSKYRFKPSTSNTLSIRPNIYTAFNKLAENIDFVVYGHRKTLFTRYEPEWFNQNENGIPSGLPPAFRVHAHIDNSVEGSIESGVFRETIVNNSIAMDIKPDLNPKITINMHEPYKIASLTGIKIGVIKPAETNEENDILEKNYGMVIDMTAGASISGSTDISKYADLSINGTTYTSGLITNDIVLGPVWSGELPVPYELSLQQKIYAVNYPLTINNKGQIVSLIPPPKPEAPGKPLNITAMAGNQSVVLDWSEPEDTGGSTITDYIIEYSSDNGDTWNKYEVYDTAGAKVKNTDTKAIIQPLNNNIGYIFRVYAVNSIGIGLVSEISPLTTPTNNGPTSPRNIRVIGQNEGEGRPNINVVLSWDEPVSKGLNGLSLTYSVEYVYDDGLITTNNASWTSVTTSNISEKTITIQNIDLLKFVYFKVTAYNDKQYASNPTIYRSAGTGPDPRVTTETANVNNPYNFGTILCSGVCV